MEGNKRKQYSTYLEDDMQEVKMSPFVYSDSIKPVVRHLTEKTNLSVLMQIKKGTMGELDWNILQALYDYGYLNAFMIRNYIAYMEKIDKMIEATALRGHMKQLVTAGLVERMELIRGEDGEEKGSSFIYSITPKGIKFLRLRHPYLSGKTAPKVYAETLLNMLVVNQYLIMLLRQYDYKLVEATYGGIFYHDSGAESVCVLRFPDDSLYRLFVVAIRCGEDWKNRYVKKMRKIAQYSARRNMPTYSVLVLCETEFQAMDAEKTLRTEKLFADLDVFYATDTIGVSEDVLGRLIEVKPEKNYKERRIFKLDI